MPGCALKTVESQIDSLNWDSLANVVPELADLLEEARSIRAQPGPNFCTNLAWYGEGDRVGFKDRLVTLVGWEAGVPSPLARSEAAYRLAYETLFRTLPRCTHPRSIFC